MAFAEYKNPKNFNWQLAGDPIQKTAYYEHVLTNGPVITVNTLKGIIEIHRMEINIPDPEPAFASAVQLYINNPNLDLSVPNRDKVYVQVTPYYSPGSINDKVIPYIIPNGFLPQGLGVQVYNAAPVAGGADFEGPFYIYYEIYTIE